MKDNGCITASQSVFAWFCGEMRRCESSLSDLTLLVFPTCISFISPCLTFLTTQIIVQTTSGRPRRSSSKKGLFGGLLGGFGNGGNVFQANGGGGAKRVATSADIMRHRQGAIKVEPKVFFANERTFLAWLHCAVLLAGASIAIMSFAETDLAGQLYGVILLPVSIAFMTYAMSQCELECQLVWFAYGTGTYLFCFLMTLFTPFSSFLPADARRSSMIRRRAPGPYEDITGPTVLGIVLMLSILAQFSIKLYDGMR